MTWSAFAGVVFQTKVNHDRYYHGRNGRHLSGLRHLRVLNWRPDMLLAAGIRWLEEYLPEALQLVDWSVPQVLIADLSGSESAGVIVRGDRDLEWTRDEFGLVPLTDHTIGNGEGLRRLQHRLAACAELEGWFERWEHAGGEGKEVRIEFDVAGLAVVTPWEDET